FRFYHSFVSTSLLHPNLHSFPTRRSSDLSGRSTSGPPRAGDPATLSPECPPRSPSELQPDVGVEVYHPAANERRRHSAAGWSSRSEEHTSELQSLRHLVCRLLLEKKNEI